jgi:hypothetical protein
MTIVSTCTEYQDGTAYIILSLWTSQGRIVADFEAEVEDDLEPLFRRGDVSCVYSSFA